MTISTIPMFGTMLGAYTILAGAARQRADHDDHHDKRVRVFALPADTLRYRGPLMPGATPERCGDYES